MTMRPTAATTSTTQTRVDGTPPVRHVCAPAASIAAELTAEAETAADRRADTRRLEAARRAARYGLD